MYVVQHNMTCLLVTYRDLCDGGRAARTGTICQKKTPPIMVQLLAMYFAGTTAATTARHKKICSTVHINCVNYNQQIFLSLTTQYVIET
jgi:hypothetical protein